MTRAEFFAGLRRNYGHAYNEGRGHFDGYQGTGHWENRRRWRETATGIVHAVHRHVFDVTERAETAIDIGCGRGTLVEELRRLDVRTWGVDLGDDVRRPWSVVGNLCMLPFRGTFDVVIALDVVEHVPTDYQEAAWRELYRLTGRALVVTVPTEEPFFRFDSSAGHRNHYVSLPPISWELGAHLHGFKAVAQGEDLARFGAPFRYGPANYPFVFVKEATP